MNEPSHVLPSEDRTLAGLCHLLGWLVALIIWAIQKDKSRYVRFQGAQALAFDVVVILGGILLFFVLFTCLFALMFLGIAGMIAATPQVSAPPGEPGGGIWLFWMAVPFLPIGMFACLLPFFLGIFIARLIAAIRCFQGQDFQYPWLGKQIKKWQGESSAA